MKIKRLKILTSFRGLPAGYEILFNDVQARNSIGITPICFVGLNGSGKSNVLEVIAEIFYYIETYHKAPKDKLKSFQTGFGFEIDYELPRVFVMSARTSWDELNSYLDNSRTNPIIKIKKQINEYPQISVMANEKVFTLRNKDNNRNEGLLPARIVAYSSGMNELLSNPFIKMDFNYFEDLKAKTGNDSLAMNRMFFLNYDSNKLIAVSNFLFDADDYDMSSFTEGQKATDFGGIDLSVIKRELCVEDLHSFVINLKLKKSLPLHSALNIALSNLKKCATFINESTRETKNDIFTDIELVYWVNKSTKEAFRYYFKTAYDLFRVFYFLQLLNIDLISQDIRKAVAAATAGSYDNLSDELPKHEASNLAFRISGISFYKQNSALLNYRKFSDGEHQLLQVFGSLLLMDTTGSLFLLDEPDTHFNPDWRSKFVHMANESIDKERDQEIILTTHSPYIVSDCRRECVYIFQRNPDGTVSQPKSPDINTFGTSIDILSDVVFGKDDTISELSKKKIDEIRQMPLETLEDIQAAKEASRVLGESVEKVLLFKYLITKESELKNDKGI
ncbi:restriction system-associated AAA family ATPase [Desulfosporosinus hippei]|uniref:Restriction system-associated AAA family ATPase n=1 Tax=Desulfosporosinus hippei DSM 8344 TaxID=1121419 RepID=A0A1G8L6N4_9FIRM|nr:restriction system-associated AAA family ATPase [Desulfosporosinus hippei]SDI50890.1 restriction system-associated AAA family ATPase [Desulfosporosinus hippei DSM 8344]